jgi:hypothetical protein
MPFSAAQHARKRRHECGRQRARNVVIDPTSMHLVAPYHEVWLSFAEFLFVTTLASDATVEKDRGRETLAAYVNRCHRADDIDRHDVCRSNDASRSNGASC